MNTEHSTHTPLINAILNESLDELKVALTKTNTIDEQDECGRTALAVAAIVGDAKAAQLLLEAGASVDCTDKNNVTPLMFAASRGVYYDEEQEDESVDESAYVDVVKVLLDHNANPNHQSNDEVTVLTAAVCAHSSAIVRLLLDTQKIAYEEAEVALVMANMTKQSEIVDLLVSRNITMPDLGTLFEEQMGCGDDECDEEHDEADDQEYDYEDEDEDDHIDED